ncbi:MAG: flagellar biosynthesis anti-sigma factor FlgM [Succinivibrionaceae bacterium]|nr:flagellar biosynthesis anti-sigma factor FlgM [Succinivibrionaceae bacterium]
MAVNNVTAGITASAIIAGGPQNSKETGKAGLGSAAKTGAGASVQDHVEITPQARQLSGLQDKIKAAPEIDTAKVNEIKTAIGNGSYQIDGQAIAARMSEFEANISALLG